MKKYIQEKIEQEHFFKCYSVAMSDYLKSKGHYAVMLAVNPKTKHLFSLYQRSEQLDNDISSFYQSLENNR